MTYNVFSGTLNPTQSINLNSFLLFAQNSVNEKSFSVQISVSVND